jgi:hypothetical protein
MAQVYLLTGVGANRFTTAVGGTGYTVYSWFIEDGAYWRIFSIAEYEAYANYNVLSVWRPTKSWTKTAGVNTLTCTTNASAGAGGGASVEITFTVGPTLHCHNTHAGAAFSAQSGAIDVSSLTNGTAYDITFQWINTAISASVINAFSITES